MADKDAKKRLPILRRGMSEHDWARSEDASQRTAPPSRWNAPIDLETGAPRKRFGPEFRKKALRMSLFAIVLFGSLLWIIQSSVEAFQANGVSMQPGLHDGDVVIVNKLAYSQIDLGFLDWAPLIDPDTRVNKPDRGDVVIFKSPTENKELVKRVIGMPGEFVEIMDGRVYIDGKPLTEPYTRGRTECRETCSWNVPPGHYVVLGDNRGNSLDSREGWTVPLEEIDGQKVYSY